MKKKLLVTTSAFLALTFALIAAMGFLTGSKEKPLLEDTEKSALAVLPMEQLYPHVIKPRSTLAEALNAVGVDAQTVHEIVIAAKPVTNLSVIMPGTRFQIYHSEPPEPAGLTGIKFRFSALELVELEKTPTGWVAEKITEPVEIRVITFSGMVTTTLWESAQLATMDPNLIADLAEIFAWQVDFAREVRVNDRWRLSVEQKLVRGEPIGWGSILAAEYHNAGERYAAVLHREDGQPKGYYAPDGSSLRRMFLKSPLRYGRISSRFNMRRFHPVLKRRRPHLGVDYAAPVGTPIRAVGDGTVTNASWRGGGGRTIRIRHNAVYQTAYKHLRGYAKGIRNGARVKQGQIIGYVGSSGLSTGPHLHFEFYRHGRFVDPLGQKFPSADPVPANMMSQFKVESESLLKSLPQWGDLEVTSRDPANLPVN